MAQNDFSKGSVIQNILNMALPMTLAQLVNVLYNIVDRIYIGRLPSESAAALTGLGLTLPVITMVIAFANLFGLGGAPLCAIARGRGDNQEAERIMGTSFCLLVGSSLLLTAAGYLCKDPLLWLFGASPDTFGYADGYLSIYLSGTVFVMTGLGMNSFINAQGFARTGMASVLIGAVANILLDPVFIFGLRMGVQGAAIATVISQALSAAWVLRFLTGKRATLKLKPANFRLDRRLVGKISGLGLSGFVMSITNSAVQIVCNAALARFGGDIYIGVMTIINSIREVFTMPVTGLTNGAQPVMGYNYGAGEYKRVQAAIQFTSVFCILYTLAAWGLLTLFPRFFISVFNDDPQLISAGVRAIHIYFFGFFMMSLQFSGQSVFVALGKSRQAVFFSLLRKAVIVIPLTVLLPRLFGLGTNGVFLAEPISNFIGGAACFITMLATVWRELSAAQTKNSPRSR